APPLPSFPTPGLSAPVSAPAPFLPVPTPPIPLPPAPAVSPDPPYIPLPPPLVADPDPDPVPVGVTQTVSAADAAQAGLAHAADALVVGGRRYTLTGPLTSIGRSSACDVALDDASASRRHAELRRRGGKTVLVDLDSTNGTLVNGRRVREAPLRAGDRITIGTTTIVFERVS
ncbi:MAG: FHA domain-containing protein, partial [Gaiellales bacterium]